MLHPASAHFAVVLPILALILGIAYLIKPSQLMSKISTRFMVFASIFLIIAFFTGKNDGGEAYILLTEEGQSLLLKNKDFGLYLAIGMFMVTLMKLYGHIKVKLKAEIFSILLVAIVSAGILYQGKMGGELTYTYGANVESHSDGIYCLAEQAELADEDE